MPHNIAETIERPDWLPTDTWPFAARTFANGDRLVHYLDEGSGPTVVLVHAGMWSFVWRDLIKQLVPSFRVIAIDYPGAGLTGGDKHDVDLPSFVGLTDALLNHLSVEDATFVVHDLGGAVGVNAAARNPQRVNGIVAINSFAWPAHRRALRAMLRVMGGPTATGLLGSFRVIPRMTRSKQGVGLHLSRHEKAVFFAPYRLSRRASRNFHRVMRSAVKSPQLFESAKWALESDLAHKPALLIFGEKNDPFGFADIWQSYFPHATSHVIEDGNHFPMCDDPQQVASWFADWHGSTVAAQTVEASHA